MSRPPVTRHRAVCQFRHDHRRAVLALFDAWAIALASPAAGRGLTLGCPTGGADLCGSASPARSAIPSACPMQQAAELAAEEINATGGINGRRLELVIRDDYADPDSAVFVAGDLYDSGVSAVVGHLFSGTTLAAAPVYNGGTRSGGRHLPLVVLARRDRRRRLHLPGLSQRPAPTARRSRTGCASGSHLTRGAVLYLNDQYGRGIRQTFVAEFTRLGGDLEAVDPYLGDRPDVGPYLDRLAQGGAARVPRGGRQPERGGGDHSPGTQARPHHAGARRRRTRGHPGGGCAGRGRVPLLALFPVDPDARPTAASSRPTAGSIPDAGMPNQPAAATYDADLSAAGRDRAGRDRSARRSGGRSPAWGR